jgi:hypothetical protein
MWYSNVTALFIGMCEEVASMQDSQENVIINCKTPSFDVGQHHLLPGVHRTGVILSS